MEPVFTHLVECSLGIVSILLILMLYVGGIERSQRGLSDDPGRVHNPS
jgi:hypothetical protein